MIKNKLMVILAEKELTLTDLAGQTGIRYATLWNFAKTKTQAVNYETIDKVCRALSCDVGDILKHIGEPAKAINSARKRGTRK